jgi:RHS repeat-associated protein
MGAYGRRPACSARAWRRRVLFTSMTGGGRRVLATGLAAVLAGTVAGEVPAQAKPTAAVQRLEQQRYPSVPVVPVTPSKPHTSGRQALAPVHRPAPVWPAAGPAEVDLAAVVADPHAPAADQPAAVFVPAGSSPVRVAPVRPSATALGAVASPTRARVEVLSQSAAHAAGINGLLLRVGRADRVAAAAPMQVSVDYRMFRDAYGADWSSRLRLVQLPDCALTRPGAVGCTEKVLPSRNNPTSATVTATATVNRTRPPAAVTKAQPLGDAPAATTGGTLIALTAGPSGGAGDFTATSLAPSSSWGHGGSTGGFQWSYPMRTPSALGGPAPTLGLSYSSQSVDGRNAASNNQPSAIGEGFDYSPGFIERRYKACADDMGGTANNTEETGDLCWGTQNATLSLGGTAVELLRDSKGKWHPRRDDGSKIELLTTPNFGNGDNNVEYWKLTTADGSQYWFGRHQLPGWSGGRPTTNSVLTVPVAGNNPGEPCNGSTFATSFCNQAWRWNLDYVQDLHGNTMSLWWAKETNYYARNKAAASPVRYDRAGYLTRIDYGSDNRDNNEYAAAAPYVENTPARVDFASADRCLANCGNHADAKAWPDTPWDQECIATTNPCLVASPTFWSSKRLSVVTTKVWKALTSSYQPVDSWTLRHEFRDPGDGTRAGLWLAGITQRGLNGSTVTLPEVTFDGTQMNNRVDAAGGDWALAMNWWRVNSIKTETGGEIFVTYSDRQCAPSGPMPTPTALDNNSLRCFPVRWTPPAYTDPITDYYHKYVVTEVQQIDRTGGSAPLRTRYDYRNPNNLALWHYDEDDGLAPDDRKSWGQWRGYPIVVTTVGEGADASVSETRYFRGMHGDRLDGGGTRNVTVAGLEGGAVTDYDHFAGTAREQITWAGSTVLFAIVIDPWRSDPPIATRAGSPPAEARYVRTKTTRTRTATDTGWRRTTTSSSFDSYGMPTAVDDYGDDDTSTDDRCVVTEYARNTSGENWLLTPTQRVHGWADDCATPPTTAAQITGDTKFTFDDLPYGSAPTTGKITATETITGFTGGTRSYQQISTATYDAYGRVKRSTDVAGEATTTDFTPSDGGPVTKIVNTNPLGWADIADIDPARGSAITTTDPNSRVTEASYDALGRLTGVWLPGRLRATFPNDPSTGYTYTVSASGPTAITTRTLNAKGGYTTSYAMIDSLGRPRQTQTSAYGGGRIITDTFYDAAGRVWKSNAPYYNSGTAGIAMYSGLDADVPSQTRTLFDNAGRPIHSILLAGDRAGGQIEKWRTSTTYHGDHVDTTPPEGDMATTVWTDARGNTSKLWQYHGTAAAGGYDETRYTYHPAGQLATVTDASGNTWSHDYDIQGRPTRVEDPDTGVATMAYNNVGDLETVTDSRPETPDLAYTYDRIGRPDTLREGNTAGPVRVSWTYDTIAKGLLRSASRWINGKEYKTETVTVDAQYRPTQTKVTIPSSEGALCAAGGTTPCTFTTKATYLADGSPNTLTLPAGGGLNSEMLTYKYDDTYALPKALETNYGDATHYVTDVTYTNLYEPNLTTRATALVGAEFVQSGRYYDDATGRVTRSPILRSVAPSYIANTSYTYDASGNVKTIDDDPGYNRDTQCFTYDHQRRLTEAWTPASHDCNSAPTSSGLGGPAPYWNSWSFGDPTDAKGRIGNRLSQTEHATSTGDVTTTYSYPNAGVKQPHTLTGSTRTDNIGTSTAAYSYDQAGNTLTRPGPTGTQNLTWDAEGHLKTLADNAGNNSYVYDADGNRLISKDPNGATLHLGAMELRLTNATGQVTATRYYSFNGETVAQRATNDGIDWLASDNQGTTQVTVTGDNTQTVTQRRQTPYGTPRGTAPNWPNKLGFVGGYQDPTGLTHLGAREYDPTNGRFTSADPVIDHGNPRQLQAYTYAANNPITYSDPSGLVIPEYVTPGEIPYDCPAGSEGYACQKIIEDDPPRPEAPAINSQHTHEGLDACGLLTPGCDVANIAMYMGEGDYANAAISGLLLIPVVDWICKIKTFCRRAVGGGARQLKSIIGKGAKVAGDLPAPPSTYADDLAEILKEKAEARAAAAAAARTTPKPTIPPPAKKNPGGPGKSSAPPPARPSCKHSFDPETPVVMADGTTEPIGEINEGDRVLAQDPETGDTTSETVDALHNNQDTELTDLKVKTADGSEATLHTTQHHPFWSETRHQWVDAAQLQPGEHLRTTGGQATVTDRHNFTGSKNMRDLTVSNIHTYYVIAGNTPVLVHNTNTPIGCGPGGAPIYDIPAGSSGGPGAGQRIPPSMLEDYNIGVNADPSLPTPLCSYCRTNPATSVDHVEPRVHGGDLTDANTTPACTFCNSSKGARGQPVNPPPNYTGPFPPPWW